MAKRITRATKDSIEDAKRNLNFDDTDDATSPSSVRQRKVNSVSVHTKPAKPNGSEQSCLPLAVFVICLTFVCCSILVSTYVNFPVEEKEGSLYIHWSKHRHIYLYGVLVTAVVSAVSGLACFWLTWTITYFDSLDPGRVPPSPASPSKYRRESGHTFHLNYTMAFLNGGAVFLYLLWWASDRYILHI